MSFLHFFSIEKTLTYTNSLLQCIVLEVCSIFFPFDYPINFGLFFEIIVMSLPDQKNERLERLHSFNMQAAAAAVLFLDVFMEDLAKNASEDDSDEELEELLGVDNLLSLSSRKKKRYFPRLDWDTYIEKLERKEFNVRYRMSKASFFSLLGIIAPYFNEDEIQQFGCVRDANPITPLIALHATIRFLSGSTYLDMSDFSIISQSSFYRVVWKVIHIIIDAPEFAFELPKNPCDSPKYMEELAKSFKAIQTQNIFSGCVGAIDGWLCRIETPRKSDQINTKQFFSGHYRAFGINVQAMCDGHSRFTYANMDSPGSRNDHMAFRDCAIGNDFIKGLNEFKEKHGVKYFIVGDNAYPLSDEVMVPFRQPEIARAGSESLRDAMSTFNFFLSQNRIRIEMAFGMLSNKFRIFKHPLRQKVLNCVKIIFCAMKLHNFCISQRIERLKKNPDEEEEMELDFLEENEDDQNIVPNVDGEMFEASDRFELNSRHPMNESSVWRELLIEQIIENNISRPLENIERKRSEAIRARAGYDEDAEMHLFA